MNSSPGRLSSASQSPAPEDLQTKEGHSSPRLLIVSPDAIGSRMAGPAIRYWEWAKALGRALPVTLAAPTVADLQPTGFTLTAYRDGRALRVLAEAADVVAISGYLLRRYPWLSELGRPLIVDLSHSFVLESLQSDAGPGGGLAWDLFAERWQVLNELLLSGDFFACNSERQRDYWLGMLSALGRVNPDTYAADATLRHLVAVVPFGLPSEPPRKTRPVLKGVHPGIAARDRVIYWGGGIYDWLDPLTLIRAAGLISRQRQDVKVFFAGVRHPNPHVTPMRMVDAALGLSRQLGLTDRFVFFNDWLHYAARADYLLEADIGVSLHLEHLETRYAFRTRALDYLWAGLPMVCSAGDALADLVSQEGLGRVVPCQDTEATAAALLELLEQPALRTRLAARFEQVAARYTWEQTTQPLLEFCRSPRLAPDRGRRLWQVQGRPARGGLASWRGRLVKGWHLLGQQGVGALLREVGAFWRWQRGR